MAAALSQEEIEAGLGEKAFITATQIEDIYSLYS